MCALMTGSSGHPSRDLGTRCVALKNLDLQLFSGARKLWDYLIWYDDLWRVHSNSLRVATSLV